MLNDFCRDTSRRFARLGQVLHDDISNARHAETGVKHCRLQHSPTRLNIRPRRSATGIDARPKTPSVFRRAALGPTIWSPAPDRAAMRKENWASPLRPGSAPTMWRECHFLDSSAARNRRLISRFTMRSRPTRPLRSLFQMLSRASRCGVFQPLEQIRGTRVCILSGVPRFMRAPDRVTAARRRLRPRAPIDRAAPSGRRPHIREGKSVSALF